MGQNLDSIVGPIFLAVGGVLIALPFLFLQRLGVTSKNILVIAAVLGLGLVLFGVLCGDLEGSHYAAIPGWILGAFFAVWILIVAAVVASQQRATMIWLILGQYLVLNTIASEVPGRWLGYTLIFVGVFDIVAFLFLELVDRLYKESHPEILKLAVLFIVVGSIVVAWVGTYAINVFNLY